MRCCLLSAQHFISMRLGKKRCSFLSSMVTPSLLPSPSPQRRRYKHSTALYLSPFLVLFATDPVKKQAASTAQQATLKTTTTLDTTCDL